MRVDIRRATQSDAQAIAELYVRARRAGAATGAIPPPVHEDDDVRDWVTDTVLPTVECWLAELAPGTPVGMLVLDADSIDQLYVDPDLTSQAIGAQLIAVAKRERPNGLRLWTFVSNERAHRFYQRHGFREVQRTDGSRNEEGAADIQYAWRPA